MAWQIKCTRRHTHTQASSKVATETHGRYGHSELQEADMHRPTLSSSTCFPPPALRFFPAAWLSESAVAHGEQSLSTEVEVAGKLGMFAPESSDVALPMMFALWHLGSIPSCCSCDADFNSLADAPYSPDAPRLVFCAPVRFCFGIWPTARKQGGSDTVNFGLTCSLLACLANLIIGRTVLRPLAEGMQRNGLSGTYLPSFWSRFFCASPWVWPTLQM